MADLFKGIVSLSQAEYKQMLDEGKIGDVLYDDNYLYVTPELADLAGTTVHIGDTVVDDVLFTSDPQTQLDDKLSLSGGNLTGDLHLEQQSALYFGAHKLSGYGYLKLTHLNSDGTEEVLLATKAFNNFYVGSATHNLRLVGRTPRPSYKQGDASDVSLALLSDVNELKNETVTLSDTQTITGPKTFTENIYLANADGTVDRISHINNNFIIYSGANTGTALLNIDEGLQKIYAFNNELAFKSDIAEAGGTTVKFGGVAISELGFDLDGTTLTITL